MANWRLKAKCWESSVNFHGKNVEPAKLLCNACPVARECLSWAVDMERREGRDMPGVWGGLTASERRVLYPLLVPA